MQNAEKIRSVSGEVAKAFPLEYAFNRGRGEKPMSRRIMILTITILIFTLAASMFMLFLESIKSSENLPALQEILEDPEDGSRTLKGYMEYQLLEVWGQPEFSSADQMVWRLPEGDVLVGSDPQGKIDSCLVKKTEDLPVAGILGDLSRSEAESLLIFRFADQVTAILGEPSLRPDGALLWKLPEGCFSRFLRARVSDWGMILQIELRES